MVVVHIYTVQIFVAPLKPTGIKKVPILGQHKESLTIKKDRLIFEQIAFVLASSFKQMASAYW